METCETLMANRPALLKQSDLTRYFKAMKAAGFDEGRVEVKPDGTHVIVAGGADPNSGVNPCDRLLK